MVFCFKNHNGEQLMIITIAIPNYKNPEIIESIYGCTKQKGIKQESIEIIIISDGEKNGISGNQLNKFSSFRGKIKLFNQEQRTGVAGIRNKALELATGDIILFMDDDCIPAKDWIKQMVGDFEFNPQLIGLGGKVLPLPVGNNIVNRYYNSINRLQKPIFDKNNKIVTIITANCGFRVKELKLINGFDSRIFNGHPMGGEDIDLTIRLNKRGCLLGYNPNAIVYHKYPTSFRSIIRKYFLYGRGMKLVCLKHNINPITINQPQFSFRGIFFYIVLSFKKLKSDFFYFLNKKHTYTESSFFTLLEFIRRIVYIFGYLSK